ncbi:phage Gp37/Gp68 family protein [Desulfovibrio sp. OttesenSCG-928-M16]|nr:phage Gp37/Gp68 family protein [Desulfovibrio sp. OttesenSCG-928-M16]
MPLSWKSPQQIFVNSMSDLFHEAVPFDCTQKEKAGGSKCNLLQL